MAWVTLCEVDEMLEGQGRYVEIDGFHLAVFLHEASPSVIDDRCPHAGASLSAGVVRNGCAICPRHDWAFQLSDGRMPGSPGVAVSHYSSRIRTVGDRRFIQAELPMP